ncbi:MAG: hypothetical protein ABFC63_10840 [Thermoguttaceae bacterium]
MARIVCLAVSRKHSHFCVAGIDMERHTWIRPVSDRCDGAIPEETMAIQGGEKPSLLDILEVPLAGQQTLGEYQPENWRLNDMPWRKIGQARVESLSKYASLSRTVLHNDTDRISPDELMALPRACRSSLQLIESSNVRFARDPKTSQAWRAGFTVFGHEYDLRVTDPVAEETLNQGKEIPSECFLAVSLTEPWRSSSDTEPYCYKLVAGVIQRTNSIVRSSLESSTRPIALAEFLSAILVEETPLCIR